MKRLIAIVSLIWLSFFSLEAQGFRPRFEVGANFAIPSFKTGAKEVHTGIQEGLRLGIGIEYQFNEVDYMTTGLNYHIGGADQINPKNQLFTDKSTSFPSKPFYEFTEAELTTKVFSIPLKYGVHIPLSNNWDFPKGAVSIEGGVYVSYIYSAESLASTEAFIEKGRFSPLEKKYSNTRTDLYSKRGDTSLNRFGGGLNFEIALDIHMFYLKLGYNYDLINLYKSSQNQWKNRDIYATIGIRL